jgi:RNA polymerase sigma factor (sigma-70 family)
MDPTSDPPPAPSLEAPRPECCAHPAVESRERKRLEGGAAVDWLAMPLVDIEGAAERVSARARVSRDDAHDVVVDALMRLAKRETQARRPIALLVKTAMNLLYSQWKKPRLPLADTAERRRHEEGVSFLEQLPARSEGEPGDELLRDEEMQWRTRLIRESCSRLRRRDRAVIEEHYYGQKPLPEIDRLRGDQEGTAKSRLRRARERLRSKLKSDPETLDRVMESLELPSEPDGPRR